MVDFLWILFFGSCLVLVTLYSRIRYRKIITPVWIFISVNSFSIIFYHCRLLSYTKFSFTAHVLVVMSFMAFTIGSHLVGTKGILESNDAPTFEKIGTNNLHNFFYATALISFIGWTIQFYIMYSLYGTDRMFQEVFQTRFLGYFNLVGIIVLPLFILKANLSKWRFFDVLCVASSLFGVLLAGNKAYFGQSLITAFIAFTLVSNKRIKLKYFITVAVIAITFFALYDRYIDIYVQSTFEGSKFPEWLHFLERPYLYITGAWPAMSNISFDDFHKQPVFAMITLDFIWKILVNFFGMTSSASNFGYVNIGASYYNVYSFVGDLYRDLGIFGLTIMSFLIGFFTTRIYVNARTQHYWGHKLISSLLMYALFFSFFVYFFTFNLFVIIIYTLLFAYGTFKSSQKKKARLESTSNKLTLKNHYGQY